MTREEAIRVLNTYYLWLRPREEEVKALHMAIDALKSEQPDEDEPKRDDLIRRADAIRVVEKNSYRMAGLTELKLKCEIDALPSADRPRGKWVNTAPSYRSDNIVCDQCGYNSIARYDYCPNCGSDNRGEDE